VPWLFSSEFLEDEDRRRAAIRGLAFVAPRIPAGTLERAAAGLRAWSGARSPREISALAMPTLVVVGGADVLTPESEALAEAIAGATLLRLPGAGHAVTLEAPEAVTAALLEHFGREPVEGTSLTRE